jgi:RimJ/RimL family protein N-acetyltransferase
VSRRIEDPRDDSRPDLPTKPIIETPRLALREVVPDDLDFLAEMLADPEVMRYYPAPLDRRQAEAWLARQRERYARDGHGFWHVEERASGRPLGQAGVALIEIEGIRQPGLGYLIHRPFWRNGYATEAARASLDHAFGELDLARVVCPIRPENERSLGVARKLDLRLEGRAAFAGFEHLIFVAAADAWRR